MENPGSGDSVSNSSGNSTGGQLSDLTSTSRSDLGNYDFHVEATVVYDGSNENLTYPSTPSQAGALQQESSDSPENLTWPKRLLGLIAYTACCLSAGFLINELRSNRKSNGALRSSAPSGLSASEPPSYYPSIPPSPLPSESPSSSPTTDCTAATVIKEIDELINYAEKEINDITDFYEALTSVIRKTTDHDSICESHNLTEDERLTIVNKLTELKTLLPQEFAVTIDHGICLVREHGSNSDECTHRGLLLGDFTTPVENNDGHAIPEELTEAVDPSNVLKHPYAQNLN